MLSTCMGVAEEGYFDAHMEQLEDMLPIPDENYIIWCLEYGDTKAVERMAVKCPDGIRAAAEKTEFKRYRELMEILQRSDLELYREMKVNFQKTCREKAASEIVSRVCPGESGCERISPWQPPGGDAGAISERVGGLISMKNGRSMKG